MLNSDPHADPNASADDEVEQIVAAGPGGALMLAGIATVCVVAMWVAFYLLVFMPRGALQ
jgi:hypothetical protein